MEPVKIDFVIGGNVDSEGKKVEQQFNKISDTVNDSRNDLKESVQVQKRVIKDLEKELSALEKAYKKAAPGKDKFAAQANLNAATENLKSEKAALMDLEQSLNQSAKSHVSLRSQMRGIIDEMAAMEAAGKRNTAEFEALRAKAGQLTDQLGDATKQARILADDNAGLQGVVSGIAGISGAASAGVGAMALFGAENEKLAAIQTRLQALMAITIGLQQVANTLNKDSYFRVVTVTKAKQAWASSVGLLNTQLGISIGLSKALMAGGIGLIIAGVTAAVVAYQRWNKEQEAANKLQKEFIGIEQETAKAMAKGKVNVEQLNRIAGDQTRSMEVRNKAIKQLNALMPDYNGYIDKEGKLIANTDTALKSYLTNLYKVEKAKKLLSSIDEKDGEIGSMEAKEPESAGFWKKAWAYWVASNDASGALQAKDIIADQEAKMAETRAAAVQVLKDEKKALEDQLQELTGDQSVFDALFGDGDSGSSKDNAVQNILAQLAELNKGFADSLALDALKHQLDLETDVNKQMDIRSAIRAKELQMTLDQIEADKQKALTAAVGATKEQREIIIETYNQQAANATTASTQEGTQAEALFSQQESLKALQNYQKYAEKAVAIETWKQGQIDAINSNKGFTAPEKEQRIAQANVIAQIDTDAAAAEFGIVAETISADMMAIVRNTVTVGLEEIATQLPVLETELEKLKRDPNADQQKVAQLAAQVAKYRQQVDAAAAKLNDVSGDGVKSMGQKFADATKILSGVNGVIADIQDAFGDMLSDVGNDAVDVVQTVVSSTTGVIGVMQSTALAAGESMSAVEKASVILAIVSAAIQVITAIINLIANSFSKNAQLQKQIDQYKSELSDLQREHDKFRDSLKQMAGQKYYTALAQDARNYSIEMAKVRQMIAEQEALIENTKSKKKKAEREEELKEMQDQLQDLVSSQRDAFQSLFEELATTDLRSFAESMADAMVEGFSKGADGITEAFDNTLDDLKKSMLKKQLAIALESQFTAAFDALKKYTSDGTLSQREIDQFTALMEAGQGNAEALAEQYRLIYERMGWVDDASSETEEGIQGDVNAMKEDTGSALVGQITAMRLHVAAMLANSTSALDLIGEMLAELRSIKDNTEYCRKLERIDETLIYMKNNGIKLT